MSNDWEIVINCDTSLHKIINITEVNLSILTLKNVRVLLSAGEKRGRTILKAKRLEQYVPNY